MPNEFTSIIMLIIIRTLLLVFPGNFVAFVEALPAMEIEKINYPEIM